MQAPGSAAENEDADSQLLLLESRKRVGEAGQQVSHDEQKCLQKEPACREADCNQRLAEKEESFSKEHQMIVDNDDATTVDEHETMPDELDGKEAVEVVCTVADTISPDDPKTVEEDMKLKQEQLSTSIHHDRKAGDPLSAPSSPILLRKMVSGPLPLASPAAAEANRVQGAQQSETQSIQVRKSQRAPKADKKYKPEKLGSSSRTAKPEVSKTQEGGAQYIPRKGDVGCDIEVLCSGDRSQKWTRATLLSHVRAHVFKIRLKNKIFTIDCAETDVRRWKPPPKPAKRAPAANAEQCRDVKRQCLNRSNEDEKKSPPKQEEVASFAQVLWNDNKKSPPVPVRKQNVSHAGVSVSCGLCGGHGHNRRSCPQAKAGCYTGVHAGNVEVTSPFTSSLPQKPTDFAIGSDDEWHEMIRRLARFVGLNGHARVVSTVGEQGSEGFGGREFLGLGKWAKQQRALKKSGQLTVEKLQRLNALGFEWDGTKLMTGNALVSKKKKQKKKPSHNMPTPSTPSEFAAAVAAAAEAGSGARSAAAEVQKPVSAGNESDEDMAPLPDLMAALQGMPTTSNPTVKAVGSDQAPAACTAASHSSAKGPKADTRAPSCAALTKVETDLLLDMLLDDPLLADFAIAAGKASDRAPLKELHVCWPPLPPHQQRPTAGGGSGADSLLASLAPLDIEHSASWLGTPEFRLYCKRVERLVAERLEA